MTATDMTVRPAEQEASFGLEQAEKLFTPERREAIARFLEIPGDEPALVPYLAVCARYGLDPIMGQVWLIPQKIRGRDGSADRERLRPTAGRDGFLAIARRSKDYLGMDHDVVCARDRFRVRKTLGSRIGPNGEPATGGIVVEHEYPELQDVIAAERGTEGFDPATYRGPILGAYALVHVRGRRPTYYFASIREHGKTGTGRDGSRYWKGAWDYTSAMILKSAQSYALRIALGITGIVPADEIAENPPESAEAQGEDLDVIAMLPQGVEYPGDVVLDLQHAVNEARAVDPNLWNRAKLEMYLAAADAPETLSGLRDRILQETAAEEERQAMIDQAEADAEEIVDADVVAAVLPQEERERLAHELADIEAALEEAGEEEPDPAMTVRRDEIRTALGLDEEEGA